MEAWNLKNAVTDTVRKGIGNKWLVTPTGYSENRVKYGDYLQRYEWGLRKQTRHSAEPSGSQ